MTWRGPRTWVGWLNFLVLQWFGVRLARFTALPGVKVYRASWRDRLAARRGHPATAEDIIRKSRSEWWTILRWVWPLTGWWTDFRWIRRVR